MLAELHILRCVASVGHCSPLLQLLSGMSLTSLTESFVSLSLIPHGSLVPSKGLAQEFSIIFVVGLGDGSMGNTLVVQV